MTNVCSIKFKSRGKLYYFDPSGLELHPGDFVIVETSNGLELGECVKGVHEVPDERIVPPLRPVVRKATPEDLKAIEGNKARETEAFQICQRKIAEHGLDMKLVSVEYNFEGNKILFFFTSDGRVDFRELVKDLASIFRTRIELRQIGVRDEAKMVGGIGICGRAFCCKEFLDEFHPVSTKMAKTQSMSLNQSKISGNCGRLMCCLRYEQEAYEDLIKSSPKNGVFVETPSGYGNVTQVSLLRQKVKVSIDGGGEPVFKTYNISDIAVIPGGRPAPGEPLPSVLNPEIKREALRREESRQEERLSWIRDKVEQELTPASPTEKERKSESTSSNRRGSRRSPKKGPKPSAAAPENARGASRGEGGKAAQPAEQQKNASKKPRFGSGAQNKENRQPTEGKPPEKKRSFRPRRRPNKNPNPEA